MESRNGGLGTADLTLLGSPFLVTGHKLGLDASRQLGRIFLCAHGTWSAVAFLSFGTILNVILPNERLSASRVPG